MTVTIFHNPKCSTSRKALDLLRASGTVPVVVDYLKTGWTTDQLTGLLKRMDAGAGAILRRKGAPDEALAAVDAAADDERLLAAMVAWPVLVERPIVEGPKGVVVARPVERALEVV